MDYYKQIKEELINNEITKKVKDYSKNRSDLEAYYNVGRLLIEAQGGEGKSKYGDGLINKYSNRLTIEIGKGYTSTNLKYMWQFYLFVQNGHTVCDQLSWSHYRQLLKFDSKYKIEFYIELTKKYSLSVRELIFKIKNSEYERLDNKTKEKLINKEENKIEDFIKNPILIKNYYNYKYISEKVLKKLILEDLDNFLTELGEGFTYIKSEYKIKIGDRYNYIDLLLFNYKYNSFVVVELKITELKAEYMGQIKKYMNYVDKNIKSINQDKTIGIIICKKENKFIMEYVSDERIFRTIYKINS